MDLNEKILFRHYSSIQMNNVIGVLSYSPGSSDSSLVEFLDWPFVIVRAQCTPE